MPTAARAQRLARGWIVGLVATTAAAVSHSVAGGYRPGALSFGTALIFAGMLGTLVIGRRRLLPRLAAAVGVSQFAFHLLFSTLGSGGGSAARITGSGMPGMTMTDASAIAAPVAMSGHDHLADPGMWIAHAIAAALTILFLRRAEGAVWTMLTRLGRIVATLLTRVLEPAASGEVPRLPTRPNLSRRPAERVLVASASRRGPPLPAF